VHEGAHLWSWPFESTWLTEGWAEWAARETMRRLKLDPGEREFELPKKDTVKMPLQEWEHVGLDTDEDEIIEGYGYAKSYDMVRRLVKLLGLKRLQEANRYFAEISEEDADLAADSYAYFEKLMQEAPNRRKANQLRKLWQTRVLDDEGKALLSKRDEAWKQVRALEKRAAEQGWSMPDSLMNDLMHWRFHSFRSDLRDANKVMDTWEEAQPLFQELGWQPDDLVQRRFETESDWDRTVRAAEHRLELARDAVEVQQKIESADASASKSRKARALLKKAGQALADGNIYRADKLVAQARKLLGFSD